MKLSHEEAGEWQLQTSCCPSNPAQSSRAHEKNFAYFYCNKQYFSPVFILPTSPLGVCVIDSLLLWKTAAKTMNHGLYYKHFKYLLKQRTAMTAHFILKNSFWCSAPGDALMKRKYHWTHRRQIVSSPTLKEWQLTPQLWVSSGESGFSSRGVCKVCLGGHGSCANAFLSSSNPGSVLGILKTQQQIGRRELLVSSSGFSRTKQCFQRRQEI